MRHVEVKVKRDTQTTYVVTIPEWEIPILEYIFDEGNVERIGDGVVLEREYPSAEFEFDRLEKIYGKDSETKKTFASEVYGNAGVGIRNLKRAMLEAQEADGHEPVKPQKRVAKVAASSADPLLA